MQFLCKDGVCFLFIFFFFCDHYKSECQRRLLEGYKFQWANHEGQWHSEKHTWLRDYGGGILHPFIEAFRTHSVDGTEFYKVSQKQKSLKAGAIARKLLDAMSTLLYTHKDIHAKMPETQKSFDEINTAKAAMRVVVDSGGGTLESISKELDGLQQRGTAEQSGVEKSIARSNAQQLEKNMSKDKFPKN